MGHVIPTIDGKPSNILALRGDRVIVGTERSPAGETVGLSDVEAAIDMLWRSGELRVTRRNVGTAAPSSARSCKRFPRSRWCRARRGWSGSEGDRPSAAAGPDHRRALTDRPGFVCPDLPDRW